MFRGRWTADPQGGGTRLEEGYGGGGLRFRILVSGGNRASNWRSSGRTSSCLHVAGQLSDAGLDSSYS